MDDLIIHCQSLINRAGAICGLEGPGIVLYDGTNAPPLNCPICINRLQDRDEDRG